MLFNQNRFSKIALLISVCWILIVGIFYYPKWQYSSTEATISWDVSGYYFYLPAIFIYKDLKKQKFKDSILAKYNPASSPYQSYRYKNGNLVMKYSAGMALVYTPFFFIAHLFAEPLGYDADGFSFPYQLAIGLAGLLIAIIGLILLRKILLFYFTEKVTGTILLLYVFGTNYLEYAAISNAMTHNYLFTFYCLLIFLSIKFYENPSINKAIIIGVTIGLATLIRPTEILSCLLPLLWGVGSLTDFKKRLAFFSTHKVKILLSVVAAFIMVSIQLIYWKIVAGNYIVYSYQDYGFDFLHPHFAEGIWRFQKGWLIYTPMMIFALIGFYYLYKKTKSIVFAPLLFFICFIYVCFSWSIWWYGGSIGQRAMVQSYPVLAFPLAAFIEKVFSRKKLLILILPLVFLFSYYNLWLTHQGHRGGLLDPEYMTKAYWRKILFRYHVPVEAKKLLDTNEEYVGDRKNIQTLFSINDTIMLNRERQFSDEISINRPENIFNWIRLKAFIGLSVKEWDVWKMPQMIVRFKQENSIIKEKMVRIGRLMNDYETKLVFIDVTAPDQFDQITILFWNGGSDKQISITNVKIETFN